MPLLRTPPSASKKTRNRIRSQNIEEMVHSGHPLNQAIAASYSVARRGKKKRKKGNPSGSY